MLLFFLISILSLADAKPKAIRYSVVESWTEPYAYVDKEKALVGGAMKEIFEGISKQLDSKSEFHYYSRNRVESAVASDKIDIRCLTNESWVSKPEMYYWSSPLFHFANGIVWKKGTQAIKKLSDLNGKRLGTVTGYVYKNLEDLISQGKLKRLDTQNEAINIGLLEKKRVQYIFIELGTFHWQVQAHKISSLKSAESLLVESIPIKCGILKSSTVDPKAFEAGLEKMRQDGFFKNLEIKYGIK